LPDPPSTILVDADGGHQQQVLRAPPKIPSNASSNKPMTNIFSPNDQVKPVFSLLENAKQGEAFDAIIQVAPSGKVTIEKVGFPEGLGLQFDAELQKLSGVPNKDGEFTLSVTYSHLPREDKHPMLEGTVKLVVNPDPKSLWKNLASKRSDPDWKPDEDYFPTRPEDVVLQMAAASKRGRSHAHVGSFRDDHFCCKEVDGWRIIVMGDGAGSAKKSRRGSWLACERAVAVVEQLLLEDEGRSLRSSESEWHENGRAKGKTLSIGQNIVGKAVFGAWNAITEHAQKEQTAVKEYSTTLMVLAEAKDELAQSVVLAFGIGDGVLAGVHHGEVDLLAKGDSGDFAGQTRFLDAALFHNGATDLYERVQVRRYAKQPMLYIMTDGVGDPFFDTESKLSKVDEWGKFHGKIHHCLTKAEPGVELLNWLDFWVPGNHDDRSLGIVW
jgi:hypothetical protein